MAIAFRAAASLNNGNSTTQAVTKPTGGGGVQVGDLILVPMNRDSGFVSSHTLNTLPPGFANITGSPNDIGAEFNRTWLTWKIADGSEGATLDHIFSASDGNNAGGAIVYSGVDTSTPFDVTPVVFDQASASTTQTMPAISPVTAGCMLLNIFGSSNQSHDGVTPDASMTERIDFDNGSFTCLYVAEQLLVSAGDTGTRAHTIVNSGRMHGWTIVLRPAGGGGGVVIPVFQNHRLRH